MSVKRKQGSASHVQRSRRRDADNRVVLPSGAFVPRRVNGVNLRARIDEWNRQNPGQMASAQLMLDIAPDHHSYATYASPISSSFQLTKEERIPRVPHQNYLPEPSSFMIRTSRFTPQVACPII